MISREFIYEFSNFDDISARENDIKSRAHDILTREMGVWCEFEEISCQKAGMCRSFGAHGHGGQDNKNRPGNFRKWQLVIMHDKED